MAWSIFTDAAPELAWHVRERIGRAPCYLGTVRADGFPRVHPVGPLTPRDGRLVVTMYPTSPKGHDLQRNGHYALHAGVEDTMGGGGEVLLTGHAFAVEPSQSDRTSGYVLFELLIAEVLAVSYDPETARPARRRWTARP